MKKTYVAPEAFKICLETEEVLGISLPGGFILDDSDENNSSKSPATDFGGITLF